jgi:hypothetical protein
MATAKILMPLPAAIMLSAGMAIIRRTEYAGLLAGAVSESASLPPSGVVAEALVPTQI